MPYCTYCMLWYHYYYFTVTIESDGVPILGFLVQAWDPSKTRIGSFTTGDGMQLLDCSQYDSIPSAVS